MRASQAVTPGNQGYGDQPKNGPVQNGQGMVHGLTLYPGKVPFNPGQISNCTSAGGLLETDFGL
jgi:hypothetical protein